MNINLTIFLFLIFSLKIYSQTVIIDRVFNSDTNLLSYDKHEYRKGKMYDFLSDEFKTNLNDLKEKGYFDSKGLKKMDLFLKSNPNLLYEGEQKAEEKNILLAFMKDSKEFDINQHYNKGYKNFIMEYTNSMINQFIPNVKFNYLNPKYEVISHPINNPDNSPIHFVDYSIDSIAYRDNFGDLTPLLNNEYQVMEGRHSFQVFSSMFLNKYFIDKKLNFRNAVVHINMRYFNCKVDEYINDKFNLHQFENYQHPYEFYSKYLDEFIENNLTDRISKIEKDKIIDNFRNQSSEFYVINFLAFSGTKNWIDLYEKLYDPNQNWINYIQNNLTEKIKIEEFRDNFNEIKNKLNAERLKEDYDLRIASFDYKFSCKINDHFFSTTVKLDSKNSYNLSAENIGNNFLSFLNNILDSNKIEFAFYHDNFGSIYSLSEKQIVYLKSKSNDFKDLIKY